MSGVTLRPPTPDDGLGAHQLVVDSGVLDVNSTYAYVATFRHFAGTCVVADDDGALAGFVTGYRLPDRPDVLFVWQVGVAASHRGQGLATRMLRHLVAADEVRWLETTITPSNAASRALFRGLARGLRTDLSVRPLFSADQLGEGHEPEELFRIGPLPHLRRDP